MMNGKISGKILFILAVLVLLCGLSFFGYKLYGIYRQYADAKEIYDDLSDTYTWSLDTAQQKTSFSPVMADGYTESDPEDEEHESENVCPITVDFASLMQVNDDIIGWIYIEGTKVDYPIVKSHDNVEYLSTAVNGRSSACGSIFMDCVNNGFSDENVLIYGHNMKDGSMFHVINLFRDQEYYEQHKNIWIITPERGAVLYHIISVHQTVFDSEDYRTSFSDTAKYESFLLNSVMQSEIETGYTYDVHKNTVTLSTCMKHNTPNRCIMVLQENDRE